MSCCALDLSEQEADSVLKADSSQNGFFLADSQVCLAVPVGALFAINPGILCSGIEKFMAINSDK